MAQEFGVEFFFYGVNGNAMNVVKDSYWKNESRIKMPDKFFVSSESEAIFEPKSGDEGRWQRKQGAHYANHNGEQWVSAGIELKPPTIIMRDNKAFFHPETEGEND